MALRLLPSLALKLIVALSYLPSLTPTSVGFCLNQPSFCCEITEIGSLKWKGNRDDWRLGLGRQAGTNSCSSEWVGEHRDFNSKHLSSMPPLPPPGIN